MTLLPYGIVAAPTNLGLRPPEPTAVPGAAKAPEALREAGLHDRLALADFGAVLPGRYRDDVVAGVDRLRNQEPIVAHARALADRFDRVHAAGRRPLVIGGDCSLLLAAGLWLRRRGRFGLVHVDGHLDFRRPGGPEQCASLAGEDLAAAVGLHWPAISDVDGLGPYFRPTDSVHVGHRADDEHAADARTVIADVVSAADVIRSADAVLDRVRPIVTAAPLTGYWVHLDVDVLDPALMPAVDSPSPGGLDPDRLAAVLRPLVRDAAGLQVCVFDPELDPDGSAARLLVDLLVDVLP
ncbi:arginase family protein [Microlunatus speluncae]|uniref:arginase family protein n=1 Tax=Microlunatus speluncae TaxID=2594267 RepID=UPI0012665115|nr:arginase family protein [Microlunatus speluncae]